MERPEEEIERVVKALTCAENPESQQAAIEKYYAPDARFRHPLSTVVSGSNSRNAILGIYQWYRVMSPEIKLDIRNVTYNTSTNELFLEVQQEFHIRWSPFKPVPASLYSDSWCNIILSPSIDNPKLFVISLQEDFYHPEDLLTLIVPPLAPLARLFLTVGAVASNVNAFLFSKLGYWAVKDSTKAGSGSSS